MRLYTRATFIDVFVDQLRAVDGFHILCSLALGRDGCGNQKMRRSGATSAAKHVKGWHGILSPPL